MELGIEDKIPFKDLIRGYGDNFVSDSEGAKVPRHIERWDYMEVFDTDYDAEADYYGGCLHYRWYTCNLEQLFEKMEEMGVIEIEQ